MNNKKEILEILLSIRYLVNVSYLEIYNEEIRDLLGKDRDKSLDVN